MLQQEEERYIEKSKGTCGANWKPSMCLIAVLLLVVMAMVVVVVVVVVVVIWLLRSACEYFCLHNNAQPAALATRLPLLAV